MARYGYARVSSTDQDCASQWSLTRVNRPAPMFLPALAFSASIGSTLPVGWAFPCWGRSS